VDDKLTFRSHVNGTIKFCSQSLSALRTLRHHSLSEDSLNLTYVSKVRSKLTYAAPAWWGFTSEATKSQPEASLRKAIKFNYYSAAQPCFSQIVKKLELGLFNKIEPNPHHCLHSLLPPLKPLKYDLRKSGHNYILPVKDDRNYVNRMLYALLWNNSIYNVNLFDFHLL